MLEYKLNTEREACIRKSHSKIESIQYSTTTVNRKKSDYNTYRFFTVYCITAENTSCRTKQIPTLMQAPETQSCIGNKKFEKI